MNDVDWLTDSARLQALIAVAESGSFTAAARRLDVSQPTVSTLIASLERRIGTRLFDRSRSAVVATAAGNALIPRARELLVIAEQAAHAIDASVSPGRKHLSVAGGQALVTYTLPPALADLRAVLPGLTADVIVGDEARVLAAVRSGEAACGLVTDRTDPRDLVVEAYAEDRLVAIVTPGHRLAGASTGLAALRDETLVSRDRVNVDRLPTRKGRSRGRSRPSGRRGRGGCPRPSAAGVR